MNSIDRLLGFGTFLVLSSLVVIMGFGSCQTTDKKEIVMQDYSGKEVVNIKSNIIYLTDGDKITLQEDSIVKIFYLVRHGEKDTSVAIDPPLTDDGLARAAKIAQIMKGTRVDAIYSTLTTRTMFTVDSLADIKKMNILPYNNKSLKNTILEIKDSDDYNRIFIVGHNNTVPAIVNTLAEREIFNAVFGEEDYGNFVVVAIKDKGQPDVYKLRY